MTDTPATIWYLTNELAAIDKEQDDKGAEWMLTEDGRESEIAARYLCNVLHDLYGVRIPERHQRYEE